MKAIKKIFIISLLTSALLATGCQRKKQPKPSDSESEPKQSEPAASESEKESEIESESIPEIDTEPVSEGEVVDTYLVLGTIGLYKGQPGQSFGSPFFLENAIKFTAEAGSDLPGQEDVTTISTSTGVFESWVLYEAGMGALTKVTKVPMYKNAILYAYYSDSGEAEQESEEVEETGYGLKFGDGRTIKANETSEVDYEGRKQYVINSASFTKDETFSLYDFENDVQWAVDIDPYSFGANGDASKVSQYVSRSGTTYTVNKSFTAKVYIKLKNGNDQIYFQLL